MTFDFRDQLDGSYQDKEQIAVRIGWVILAVLLIAGLAGFFGGGPLSRATAKVSDGDAEIAVNYPRWGRMHSSLVVDVTVHAPLQDADQLTLIVANDFAQRVAFENVFPQPDSTGFDAAGTVMTWNVDDWGQVIRIRLHYKAQEWRSLRGGVEVRAENDVLGSVEFSQFLFP